MYPLRLIRLKLANKLFPLILFQFSSFAIPWLITIWLTYQSGLAQAGEFSFALAIISPLCILLAVPSRNFLLTESKAAPLAAHSRFSLMFIGFLISISFGIYFNSPLLFAALFLFKSTELLFDIPISLAIRKAEINRLWRLSIMKWLIIIQLSLVGFYTNNISLTFILGALLFIFFTTLKSKKQNVIKDGWPLIKLISTSAPLGLSTLIFAIHFNLPRYLLGIFGQQELLAIYSISSFIIMASIVFINIYIQSKLPFFKDNIVKRCDVFQKEQIKVAYIVFGVFIVIQMFNFPLLSESFWAIHNNVQLERDEYSDLFTLVLFLAWGPISFSIANYFLIISGQHKSLVIITIINTLFTYVICYLGYKFFNVTTMLISYNFGCIMQCFAVYLFFTKKNILNE